MSLYNCFSLFLLFVLHHAQMSSSLTELYTTESESESYCSPSLSCGDSKYNISYPFRLYGDDSCGHPFELACVGEDKTLVTRIVGKDYKVNSIDYKNHEMNITDLNLFDGSHCSPHSYANLTLDFSLLNYSSGDSNLTVYLNCSPSWASSHLQSIGCPAESSGSYYNSFFSFHPCPPTVKVWDECSSVVYVPINETATDRSGMNASDAFLGALKQGFGLTWIVGDGWCEKCMDSRGLCRYDENAPSVGVCYCWGVISTDGSCKAEKKEGGKGSVRKFIGIGAGVVGALLIGCISLFIFKRRKRLQQSGSSNLLSRSISSKISSKNDPELGASNYHTHIFSYDELEEATNGFNTSGELGDGGFGTVYKGKLRDGRTVAVKRLYEHNYRRLEQFMNEVEILSRLRHQNLVTLYGCTSRHSRELLLVYEYIPNGTVADHLHGSKCTLPWPVRMSISIETADALAYLHAVEPQIIHRDVKTSNILLDNNYHVKVADFGLSRLFPLDATHVSTAPQGTPGYVDPEYHQCYQLTDKSDVYSFGVVLVELISSKPAVDISRHRNEINLANLAVTKIQNCKIHELVDPELRYDEDLEVKVMIEQVAEVAFRCLQLDSEMRPSIREVLEMLRGIEGGGYKAEKEGDGSEAQTKEESRLLKNVLPFSPDTVAERWQSRSTTPSTST